MFTGGLTQHCLTQLAPAVPTAEDICVTTGFDRMRRSKSLHGAATDHLCLIASRCLCLCRTVATTVSGHSSELPSRSVLKLTRVGPDVKCTWLLLLFIQINTIRQSLTHLFYIQQYVRATCFDLVGHPQTLQEHRFKRCLVFLHCGIPKAYKFQLQE